MPPRIAVVIPVYNHWDYVMACVESLIATTPGVRAVVVDDASPTPPPKSWLKNTILDPHIYLRHRYNRQLTATWNTGFQTALALPVDYVVAGNSDILFSPLWWEGLEYASQRGYHLVGPMTNTPGNTKPQDVTRFVPDYTTEDKAGSIATTAARLATLKGLIEPTLINGFFMWAKTEHWKEGQFAENQVFRPSNPQFLNGRRNPTPYMTGNEDELQARWRTKGWKFGVACGSFIFHYRSVTRGVKYAKGKWSRR